jgi:thioredoxin reductase (NADPH)
MLTTAVENFPGFPDGVQGPDLMLAMRKQAERFGAEFIERNVEKVDFARRDLAKSISAGGGEYLAKTVIIATGAQTLWLDAPGARELIGRGVSSCAPCDAPFFKGKKVAVVGGGDAAIEEALVLTRSASEVTIIHRRDAFRASKIMQDKVLSNPKVKVLWNTEVQEVVGQPARNASASVAGGDKVNSLKLKNNRTGEVIDFPVDGLFVAIGHKPDNDLFAGKIEMDEKGFIVRMLNAKSQMLNGNNYKTMTSVPGVFVAGDCEDAVYKQAITAAGEGCKAALEVLKYLEEVKG